MKRGRGKPVPVVLSMHASDLTVAVHLFYVLKEAEAVHRKLERYKSDTSIAVEISTIGDLPSLCHVESERLRDCINAEIVAIRARLHKLGVQLDEEPKS